MNAQPLQFADICLPLVEWYRGCHRDLPWRRTADPYRVWVSEIMLQQTRVEAVKPYYERFLTRLPDVAALAACPDDELNKLWEGLGYYSRARNLKAAARQIVALGRFPDSYDGLLQLKGIGGYTAAAVGSIAFGLPVAVVDGNVLRVVSRLCCLEEDVMDPRVRREIFAVLSAAMPQGKRALNTATTTPFGIERNDAGDFNQAMMELGACVCLPNGEPQCAACPLQKTCGACAAGTATGYPLKSAKKARRIEQRTVLVLRFAGRVALRRRPESGLLAGLWEFPAEPGTMSEEAVRARYAGRVTPLGTAKHVFTHIEWHMVGYEVELDARPADETLVFATPAELEQNYALPTALEHYRRAVCADRQLTL